MEVSPMVQTKKTINIQVKNGGVSGWGTNKIGMLYYYSCSVLVGSFCNKRRLKIKQETTFARFAYDG